MCCPLDGRSVGQPVADVTDFTVRAIPQTTAELALESGKPSGEHVLNVLARLKPSGDGACLEAAATPLKLAVEPLADVQRYDRLRGADCGALLNRVNPTSRPATKALIDKIMHCHDTGQVAIIGSAVIARVEHRSTRWYAAGPIAFKKARTATNDGYACATPAYRLPCRAFQHERCLHVLQRQVVKQRVKINADPTLSL